MSKLVCGYIKPTTPCRSIVKSYMHAGPIPAVSTNIKGRLRVTRSRPFGLSKEDAIHKEMNSSSVRTRFTSATGSAESDAWRPITMLSEPLAIACAGVEIRF